MSPKDLGTKNPSMTVKVGNEESPMSEESLKAFMSRILPGHDLWAPLDDSDEECTPGDAQYTLGNASNAGKGLAVSSLAIKPVVAATKDRQGSYFSLDSFRARF
jgi:hypothetical protein